MDTFLLIDDHMIVRSGIKGLLSEIFHSSEIDEAADNDSALKQLKDHRYDLIIMDIKILKTDTLWLMHFINSTYPGSRVLIFSMRPQNIHAARFLKAGALGYLSKEASLNEITKAISVILKGGKYIPEPVPKISDDEYLLENERQSL